jgi:hypothetical protein
VLKPGIVSARTPFQARRLIQAVTAAQLYLSGTDQKSIASTLQLSEERARQIIKLGIDYMMREGWLKPPASQEPVSSPSTHEGSDRGLN